MKRSQSPAQTEANGPVRTEAKGLVVDRSQMRSANQTHHAQPGSLTMRFRMRQRLDPFAGFRLGGLCRVGALWQLSGLCRRRAIGVRPRQRQSVMSCSRSRRYHSRPSLMPWIGTRPCTDQLRQARKPCWMRHRVRRAGLFGMKTGVEPTRSICREPCVHPIIEVNKELDRPVKIGKPAHPAWVEMDSWMRSSGSNSVSATGRFDVASERLTCRFRRW